MIKDSNAEVLYQKKIGKDYSLIGLKTGWAAYVPGQFVMVRVPDESVYLRRPFGILRSVGGDGIELFYKIIGRGTNRLSMLREGERLQVMGPLGNGFTIPQGLQRGVVIVGGYGIAPVMGLVDELMAKKAEVWLYYGGRSRADIQFLDHFKKDGIKFHITTEDGSLGTKGMITELLLKDISNISKNSQIYCCGPKGLISAVAAIARDNNLPAQISYETYMGCGIGVCLGCAVKTKEGYVRACKEGPVFDVDSLAF